MSEKTNPMYCELCSVCIIKCACVLEHRVHTGREQLLDFECAGCNNSNNCRSDADNVLEIW